MKILIPVSAGELVDKLSILDIKSARITDPGKLDNVARERGMLEEIAKALPDSPELRGLCARLLEINTRLWDVEDELRELERRRDWGPAFVELARAVYVTNDERARVKKAVDQLLGSSLTEEKSYRPY